MTTQKRQLVDLLKAIESGAAPTSRIFASAAPLRLDASGVEFWSEYKRRYLDSAREGFGHAAAERTEARGAAVAFDKAVQVATLSQSA